MECDGDGDILPFIPQIDVSVKNKIEIAKDGIGIQLSNQTFLKAATIKYEVSIKEPVELPDLKQIKYTMNLETY